MARARRAHSPAARGATPPPAPATPSAAARPRRAPSPIGPGFVGLSADSAPAWVPPSRARTYALLDAAYALAVGLAAASAAAAAGARAGGVGGGIVGGIARGLGAHWWVWLLAVPAAAAALTLALSRAAARPSHAGLLAAEAALLASVRGRVTHHWAHFRTGDGSGASSSAGSGAGTISASPGAGAGAGAGAGSGAAAAAAVEWHVHALSIGVAGGGGSAADEAVVLLHGHSSSAVLWQAALDRLSSLGRVFVLDLPGWGRSPAPAALLRGGSPSAAVALHVEMLAGWAAAVGLRRLVLVGHSMGGFYAVHLAAARPALVRQLVLIAPAGLLPMARPDGGLGWGLMFRCLPPQRFARRCGRLGFALYTAASRALLGGREDARFPALYYQLAYATHGTGAGDAVAARFFRYSCSRTGGAFWWARPALAELLALRVPLSVIWGEHDELFDAALAPLLHRIRPRTDVYVLAGAPHNPSHYAAPHLVCNAIRDAVLKQRSGGAQRALVPATAADAAAAAASGRLSRAADTSFAAPYCAAGGADAGDDSTPSPLLAPPLPSPSPPRSPVRRRPTSLGSPVGPRRADGDGDSDSDFVLPALTPARGICHACSHVVILHKAYWRCACAAWTFNGHASAQASGHHFDALLAFLDELYVKGTFNARTSPALVHPIPAARSPGPPPRRGRTHDGLPRVLDTDSGECLLVF